MESSLKENPNNTQRPFEDISTNAVDEASHNCSPTKPELSQLELINQWRSNLEQLLEDLKVSDCENITADELKDITPDIVEKLNYIKKTDELLKQHDDFTLSEDGFDKYKNAHLLVVNFLTQIYQQEKEHEDVGPVKFYFFSRTKHILQQSKSTPWTSAFFHLLLLIITSLTLVILAGAAVIITQNNGIVWALLCISFYNFFIIAKRKIKIYKSSALTPVRFTISLLSICALNVFIYALLFVAIPALITLGVKPYWLDDIIILGLGLFSFVILGHPHESNEEDISLAKTCDSNEEIPVPNNLVNEGSTK